MVLGFLFLNDQGPVMSLIIKAGSDSEDVSCAFIWCDDWSQAFHLFVVSKVFDPVGAAGGRQGNVPLDGSVTLSV